jgi:Protein of unknown function (DUF1566)
MKHALRLTIGLSLLCALAVLAAPAQAQTTANGPYYATPSWDQKLQCDTQATCPRFIVLSNWNNEAVLDRESGLVWDKTPDQFFLGPWLDAQVHCNARIVGSRAGWRLPALQELGSLLDPSAPAPLHLPAGHPFINIRTDAPYWSATSFARDTSASAWR